MKYLLLLAALAACAPGQPVFKPVEVDMPIAVPCQAVKIAPPDFALDHMDKNAPLDARVKAALVQIDQQRAYEQELQAQLAFCQ